MKKKVLVASFYNRQAIAPALERLSEQAEVIRANEFGRSFTESELISRLDGIDAVIAADEPYGQAVFESAPQLSMIARDGVGFDGIDLKAATRAGVVVTNAPVLHETAADLAFGLILAVVRKVVVCDRGVRRGKWTDRDFFLSSDVHGKTLGILGFGRIGKAVARRACGFNMTILCYDPYVPDISAAEKMGVRMTNKDELFRLSDIITVHLPLTPETKKMIDAGAIAKMKDGAYLINTARGEIIDESALVSALKSGKLGGAGLDVICNEPPVSDNPLLLLENVVITPHVGSDTFDTFRKIFECVVDNILLFFAGEKPHYVLNPEVFQHRRDDNRRCIK